MAAKPSGKPEVEAVGDDGKEKAEAPPVVPAHIPRADDAETLAQLKAGQAKLEKMLEAGEIKGASESSIHALTEELRQFRTAISQKQTEKKEEPVRGFFDGF